MNAAIKPQQAFNRLVAGEPSVQAGISLWLLVDADGVSGRRDLAGQMVLQEWRGDNETPYHHWGFMTPRTRRSA